MSRTFFSKLNILLLTKIVTVTVIAIYFPLVLNYQFNETKFNFCH